MGMKLEDVEIEGKTLIYKGIPFEDAEYKELAGYVDDIGKAISNAFNWLGEKVSEVMNNISNSLFKSNYQTERYIAMNAPKFWLRTYWGFKP
jgi:hypothetical protein